jgi:hypothetical protein
MLQASSSNPSPHGEVGQKIEYFSTLVLTNHQRDAYSSGLSAVLSP